jgi:hypothetical protein
MPAGFRELQSPELPNPAKQVRFFAKAGLRHMLWASKEAHRAQRSRLWNDCGSREVRGNIDLSG